MPRCMLPYSAEKRTQAMEQGLLKPAGSTKLEEKWAATASVRAPVPTSARHRSPLRSWRSGREPGEGIFAAGTAAVGVGTFGPPPGGVG